MRVMGYLARGPPFFAWVVDETKEEVKVSCLDAWEANQLLFSNSMSYKICL